jgi:hypothetical protein
MLKAAQAAAFLFYCSSREEGATILFSHCDSFQIGGSFLPKDRLHKILIPSQNSLPQSRHLRTSATGRILPVTSVGFSVGYFTHRLTANSTERMRKLLNALPESRRFPIIVFIHMAMDRIMP